jgi:hypothetical protein
MSIYSKLRRTTINEGEHYKLRRLLSEADPRYYDEEHGILKLKNLCLRDIQSDTVEFNTPEEQSFTDWLGHKKEFIKHTEELQGSVYCQLYQLSQNLDSSLKDRLDKDLNDIYDFLRKDLKVDNRRKFHGLIWKILEHDNPANSINLVANYVRNTESVDEVIKTLNSFRKKYVGEEGLEEFLKKAKYSEYTKYENRFVGSHFDRHPTFLRLKYKINRDDKHIVDLIEDILMGRNKVSNVVTNLYQSIRDNYSAAEMVKGDLICTKPVLNDNGDEIIKVGESVEVKKLDYQADSYLSEFFSIYKRKDLPEHVYTNEFLNVYNKVIDGLFVAFQLNGSDILEDIKKDFAGIMYDGDNFIKDEDITLYWSNKGRSTCKEHRLSIRYRINKPEVIGYVFDRESGLLTEKSLKVRSEAEVFCPFSR